MKATRYLSRALTISVFLVMIVILLPLQRATALSEDVVISQVYGGGGNAGATHKNDFVELFNRGTSAVSLNGWSIQYASATGTGNFGANSGQLTPLPNISLEPGQYLLVQEASSAGCSGAPCGVDLPTPDVTDTSPINMSGSAGKVALVMSSTGLGCNGGSTPCSPAQLALIKDLVGYGSANFFETTPAPGLSNSTADIRNSGGCAETDDNSADFTAVTPPAPRNTASPLHSCTEAAPSVASVSPANRAIEVALDSNLQIEFSEAVNVSGDWFNVSCDISGAHAATVSGGPTTFTLDPQADFAGGDYCTLTVYAANVSDQDADDPPDVMDADFTSTFDAAGSCELGFTPIYEVQGDGLTSPITGTVVTLEGVVVGDFQNNNQLDNGNLNGFYVQDPTGDGDAATSDGIFIFAPDAADVLVGDGVRVRGTVSEFFGMTEVSFNQVWTCSSGNTITPAELTLPVTSLNDFEPYEGMLVTFPQPLVIAEYFNYDRFGEIVLSLPIDGQARMYTPTSVVEPGVPAIELALQNSLRRITLDDGVSGSNPATLRHPDGEPFSLTNLFRGGDLVQNATGVLSYDFSLYRIMPTGPADFTAVNPRPTVPDDVGGRLHIAAMNTLNYFVTLDYPSGDSRDNKCGPLQNVECRGADADQPDEFARQRTKLLAALSGLDASVIGLNEIENTPNVEPLADIASGLNDIFGAGTYDYIDTGVIGPDAIRVGLIYRPADVTPVGDFEILTSAVDPRFDETRNRPALAQTFSENSTGARFTVVVNHLKSKGSTCSGDPDIGDGQGNCNQTRFAAAQALVDWLTTDPTGSSDPDFIIMGDLNSYAMEDPIDAIKAGSDDIAGTEDDYTNLIYEYQGQYAYSYVFDGQNGYLDHALANADLTSQVTGVADWHINADEADVVDYDTSFKPPEQEALYEPNAYRASDHDAVIVGLNLFFATNKSITGGGWIDSPAGAYLPDPTIAGKGEFKFDAKYVSKNNLPVGSVNYVVEKAGLYFTATGIDWLSVYGNNAWIYGAGSLNGADGYRFLLTAVDDVDAFRIQIWEVASGALIYDSQPGDGMFDPATSPLGGGKIVIR